LKVFGPEFRGKLRTIPGGIRASMFPEVMPREEIQKVIDKYDLPTSKIALFTGRLISEKGVEYLIKAASKINGHVLIAGDGPQKEKLKKMVTDLKLKNVKMLGHFDYDVLIKLYYLADVFISPAVWDEPLGLTIIEAMASGTPVVVTRRGGVTMAVKDGVNGFYVRSRNATDIASEVNRLFANPTLAEKMGKKAREVVLKRFTWTDIAKRFDPVYRRASY
jgi:glycosyltransferase involved in cell wall biosynthesis